MSDKRNATRLMLITVIAAIILPLINTVGVWLAYKVFASDIAYPAVVSEILKYVYSILEELLVYASAFCLAYAFAARRGRLAVVVTVCVAEVLICAATVFTDYMFYGSAVLGAEFIRYNAVLCVAELVRCTVVVLAAFIAAKRIKSVTVCALSTLVVFIIGVILCVNETVSILVEAANTYSDWWPQNISEWMTLIMPYISTAIYALAGYLVSRFLLFLIERNKRACEGETAPTRAVSK